MHYNLQINYLISCYSGEYRYASPSPIFFTYQHFLKKTNKLYIFYHYTI